MSKPRSMTPRKLLRLLVGAGFVVQRQKGSHTILKHPESGRYVVVPMHPRDLPKGTLHDILKNAGLNKH
ncbi:MAG: hypothetical protein A2901_05345 [Elusimicrobia bacterium RIFCSPLOWO2_01_FULL_54_10]|nr:MAG: hypothetical protein A2901_05345 [Elusimicrobia bacterium RIFCSPLOWO2_01_FULL_54_10]